MRDRENERVYLVCDVDDIGTGIIPVCAYPETQEDEAVEHAETRKGFVLEAWAGTSVYRQPIEVYHVSLEVDPADVVDQAREGHPRAAELAELVLDWMIRDIRWRSQEGGYWPASIDPCIRAHQCVVEMMGGAVYG